MISLAVIDTETDRCNFPFCRFHVDGICHSEEHRKDCLDIALAVLCLDKKGEDEGRS